MQPEARVAGCLWDMLEYSRLIAHSMAEVEFVHYSNDRPMQMFVERGLEIIGEAARRIPEDFRQSHPEIPWRRIIGQRNVLSHEYGEIKQAMIWRVVRDYIPELIAALEALNLIPPEQ